MSYKYRGFSTLTFLASEKEGPATNLQPTF
jgi:hypothetical protein